MFIILGLVIISIFGFVFFLTGQVQRQQSQAQAEKIVGQVLETTALRFYVNLCTESALEQGIDLLSRQGGKIFPGQKGSILKVHEKAFFERDEQKNKTYRIGYGILNTGFPVPIYPCTNAFADFNVEPAFCTYRSANPRFSDVDIGIVNLPDLCKSHAGGCSPDEGWNSQFSVQAELESFVSAYVKDCVDFDSIIGINQTYNVTEGEVSANITFSEKNVIATVNFPLIVAPIGSQPVIKLISFQNSFTTRFKQIYSVARNAVVTDVSSKPKKTTAGQLSAINFRIVDDFNKIVNLSYSRDSGFRIHKTENVSLFDDMIEIVDTSAEPGKELVMNFMIENRPPVLEYLDPLGPYDKDPPAGCGIYDLYALQDHVLQITPSAFDPDEDGITYSYSGWLTDYNETNIVSDDSGMCPIVVKQQKKLTQPRWKIENPNTGTVSALMTKEDIGYHTFTITVCDAQYCDYETFRVLVDDLIAVDVNKTNPYGSGIFSLEDPFQFSAKIKDLYNPGNYVFSWLIKQGTSTIYTNNSGGKELNLPFSSYNILTIANIYKVTGTPLFKKGTLYDVIGSVLQGGAEVGNSTQVVAQECVPFTNGKPPYPYNVSDPFLADHMCCINDGGVIKVADSKETCFTQATYGSVNSFSTDKYKTSYDTMPDSQKIGGVAPKQKKNFVGFNTGLGTDPISALKAGLASGVIYANSNDIIKRSFERNCDGTRGNLCVGDMTETYAVIESCQDKAADAATCFGPPIKNPDLSLTNSETTSPQSCTYYDQTTFEKEFGASTSIVCSAAPKCVTDPSSISGFVDLIIQQDVNAGIPKRYLCNATCSQNGCAQTLPSLCHDSFQDQTCKVTVGSTANPTQPSYGEYREITYQASDNNCGLAGPQVKKDVCSDIENLTDVACNADLSNPNNLYVQQRFNCAFYNEQSATDNDNGDVPLSPGTCTYQRGSCTAGSPQCISGSPVSVSDGKATNTGSYGVPLSNGASVYAEYYPADKGGDPTKKESCQRKDYDFDTLSSSICTSAGFNWYAAGTGSKKCCGDDATDDWRSGPQICR